MKYLINLPMPIQRWHRFMVRWPQYPLIFHRRHFHDKNIFIFFNFIFLFFRFDEFFVVWPGSADLVLTRSPLLHPIKPFFNYRCRPCIPIICKLFRLSHRVKNFQKVHKNESILPMRLRRHILHLLRLQRTRHKILHPIFQFQQVRKDLRFVETCAELLTISRM